EEWESLPWTIVLPPTVYGPRDVDVYELFKLARRGLRLFYGNREQWISTIYVDDLIRGMALAATQDAAVGRAYFFTDDTPTTWADFQGLMAGLRRFPSLGLDLGRGAADLAGVFGELLTSLDGKARVLNRQKARLNHAEAWLFDGSRARAELGFRARVSQLEGVRRTDAWYRDEGWY
ncbi:MAG: NAD(P)-dependent oxidoreductase, partial [Myxococcota bacterium]